MKNYNEIIKAVAPLAVIILLSVIVARFTLTKIGDQSVQIAKFQKENTTLNQKVKVLSSLTQNAQEDVNAATIALPDSNSSLSVVSQLKSTALLNGIKLANLKSGSEVKDTSGLSRVDIAFEVEGPKPQIIIYLNSLSKVAPIIIVDKVKLSEVDQVSRASVTVKAFWTAFPKSLPALNESLSDLTEKEYQILAEVGELVPPQFSSSTTEETAGGRIDPFTQ